MVHNNYVIQSMQDVYNIERTTTKYESFYTQLVCIIICNTRVFEKIIMKVCLCISLVTVYENSLNPSVYCLFMNRVNILFENKIVETFIIKLIYRHDMRLHLFKILVNKQQRKLLQFSLKFYSVPRSYQNINIRSLNGQESKRQDNSCVVDNCG